MRFPLDRSKYLFAALLVIPNVVVFSQVPAQVQEAARNGLAIVAQEKAELVQLKMQVRASFFGSRFDNIEQALSNARIAGDADKISACYSAVMKGHARTAAGYDVVVRLASKWVQERPKSIPAKVMLADALIEHAWFYRGAGYADTIPASAEPIMEQDFKRALETVKDGETDGHDYPDWFAELLGVYHAIGIDRQHFDAVFNEASRRFPTYWPLYIIKSTYLMERWYGQPGDWQAFAKEASDKLGGDDGDELYARLYWAKRTYDIYQNDPIRLTGMDYNRIKKGFEVLIKRNPSDYSKVTHFFQVAKEAGDKQTMRQMLELLGNRIDFAVWKTVADYLHDKSS